MPHDPGAGTALSPRQTSYGGGVSESSSQPSRGRALQERALWLLGGVLVVGVALGVWSWWRYREVARAPRVAVVARPGQPGVTDEVSPTPRQGPGSQRLTGYVVDGAGAPVVAVEVASEVSAELDASAAGKPSPAAPAAPVADAAAPTQGGLDLSPVVSSPTSVEGHFELVGLDAGWHRVRVYGPGIFSAEVRRVQVPGEPLAIVVARKVSIVGRVALRGQGVQGATVQVTSDAIGGTVELRSGLGGAFSLPVLPEGSYDVVAFLGDTASEAAHLLRLGAGPFPELKLALEPAAVVSGRVLEAPTELGGAVAVGVVSAIELRPLADDEPPRYAQSGADGRFRIEGVHRGRWVVSAVAPGYTVPDPVEIDAGGGVVELAVSRGAVLEGRALDGAGRPLAGVTLRARPSTGPELSGDREQALLAHFGGRAIEAAAAWDPGRAVASDPRFVARGELGVLLGPIPLIPPPGARATRRGAIELAELPPEVTALARPPAFTVPASLTSRWITDEQGRFVLRGLPAGRYTLIGRAAGHAEGRRAGLLLVAGGALRDVELRLSAGTLLAGTVRDQRGAPVGGARVVAASEVADSVEVLTGVDGGYALPPVGGSVRLEVSASGHASAARRVDVGEVVGSLAAQRREDFTLVVYDAVARGLIVDSRGAAVVGAKVTVAQGPAQGKSAISGADGAFELDRLPTGPVRVALEHAELPSHQATLDPGTFSRLSMPLGGAVEGRVVDEAGLPVQGVKVTGVGPQAASAEDSSDRDGRWTLPALRPGGWRVAVQRPGFLPASRELTVPVASQRGQVTVREVTLALLRGGVAGGTVRDARGGRVADARVVVRAADGRSAEGRTDARGEFRVRDCPTGELEVVAEHGAGRASTRLFLRAGQEVTSLALELAAP